MTAISTILFIYAVLTLIKLFLSKSIWNKILLYNLFSTKFILILLCFAVMEEASYLIDISLIYSLLGFTGIIFITRFIRKRGDI